MKLVKSDPDLGLAFTPTDYQRKGDYSHFLDNDAFGAYRHKKRFNGANFLKMLDREQDKNPDFVVLPDIVAGGLASLEFSIKWLDFLEFLDYRFRWYLAVQDGMTDTSIPTDILKRISGLFVGGSGWEWKRKTAEMWVRLAKRYGLDVHVGRIGTLERIMFCARICVHSCDSSNVVRHPRNLRHLLQWKAGEHQPLTAEIFNQ